MPAPNLRPRLHGLYAITPDDADTDGLIGSVAAAVNGGCRLVQYRNKLADEALRRHQAATLADFCKRHDCLLIVNDHVELALEIDAAGVHIGGNDGDPRAIRQRLGTERILGISCYNEATRVDAALAAGADYVALGAMYASATKPHARRASLDLLRETRARCAKPIATIGGITLDNAATLVAAGADMVAVIGDLFAAADIAARARAYQNLFPPNSYSDAP